MVCYEGQHLIVLVNLGLGGLFFLVLLPPAMWFYILYHRRQRLGEEPTAQYFLFLYHSYKESFYYWEVVRMLFVLLLVVVDVHGIRLQEQARLILFLAVLGGFLLLNTMLRPHRFATVYYLEVGSLALVLTATYLFLLGGFDSPDTSGLDALSFDMPTWVMMSVFILYALVLLRYIAVSAWRTHQGKLRKLSRAVSFPLLVSYLSGRWSDELNGVGSDADVR